MSTDYCSTSDTKTWLQITDSNSDTLLASTNSEAARWVDGITDDYYYQTAPQTLKFIPTSSWILDLSDPLATTTGLSVATDLSGDGTFETSWTRDVDYEVAPVNAPFASPNPQPWRQLRVIGSLLFPYPIIGIMARPERVQVTATWGWPAIPDAVKRATIMKSAQLFTRRISVGGYVPGEATPTGYAMRVPPADQDILSLLAPFVNRTCVG